jgi:hypothetical protein
MTNFYGPANRPEDWQKLLAKPNLHWKSGYSAKSLAHCWTEAKGFPDEVSKTIRLSGYPALTNMEFLLGFPEFDVPLPGGVRPSQNDVFVLARGNEGLVTITVEGKVSESFDRPIGERFVQPSSGGAARLSYLCNLMQLKREELNNIGYQLLHRSASAVIEAKRFGASHAVMLVHSFSKSLEHFDDYSNFASLFGIQPSPDNLYYAAQLDGIGFYLGWVVGKPSYLTR